MHASESEHINAVYSEDLCARACPHPLHGSKCTVQSLPCLAMGPVVRAATFAVAPCLAEAAPRSRETSHDDMGSVSRHVAVPASDLSNSICEPLL